jgi:uncharacterized protein YggE
MDLVFSQKDSDMTDTTSGDRNGGTQLKALAFTVILAVTAALLAACGGGGDDDDSGSTIRTNQGLSVAAIGAGFDPRLQQDTGEAGDEVTDGAGRGAAPRPADLVADTRYSPYFAPALQQGNDGLTVQGYGTASTDADSAVVEFYFYSSGDGGVEPQPAPDAGSSSSGGSGSDAEAPIARDSGVAAQQVTPITEGQLQPVIDALVGAGIPRENIEFIGQNYYDRFSSSATLRVTVDDLAVLDAAVNAATSAAANLGSVQLSSTNVAYAVSDCVALEKAAMDAAADDAAARATAFAETLGVGIGAISGASHYSYSPYGGNACGATSAGPYPLASESFVAGSTRVVEVFANISVTYAIQ